MATGERAKAVTFVAKRLKKNPDVSMGELKKAAPKGMNIYPLIIGLARAEAGMAKPKRKATKKKATKRRGRPPGSKNKVGRRKMGGRRRGPGRPRKAVGAADGLASIAQHMKDLEREVEQMRAALGRIADLAGSA